MEIEDLKKYDVGIDLNGIRVEKYSTFWSKTIKNTEERNEVFVKLLENLFLSDEDVKLKVMEVCGFQNKTKRIKKETKEKHSCEEEDDCCQNNEVKNE